MPGEVGFYRFAEIIEGASCLHCAGCEHRPDALTPAPSCDAPCALRHFAVNHHESYRLLGQVVRGLHARRSDELEVRLAVFAEAVSQVLRLAPHRRALRRGHELFPLALEGALEILIAHLFATVYHTEQAAQPVKHTLAIVLRHLVGEELEEFLRAFASSVSK